MAIRLIEGDWEKKLTHVELNTLSTRANPSQWGRYLEAKVLYNIITTQEPEEIYTDVICQSIMEPRKPFRLRLFDEKKNRAGKHIIANRLVNTSRLINFYWFGIEINMHKFRMGCKACFFAK